MTIISAENSQKIKNMSIVCAILVVTLHTGWPKDTVCLTWFINELVAQGIARIAVPFFFVVSGFFLAAHFGDANWYRQEVRKRITSLFVPFVIWTAIATCLTMPLSIIADILAHRPFGTSLYFSDGRWMTTVGLDLRQGPASLSVLWYVRCLLMFVILSPIFKFLMQRLGVSWLVITILLSLFHRSTSWPNFPNLHQVFELGFSLEGIFYFSFGIWLNSHLNNIHIPIKLRFFSIAISIVFLCTNAVFVYHSIHLPINLTTVAIPFMMFSMWTIIPSTKWAEWFTSCSFPLFLLHMPLLSYLSLLIKYSAIHDTCIGSILVLTGSITTSIVITVMLKNHFPKLSQRLFAGRA